MKRVERQPVRQAGFTLLELLVVLAIAGLTLTVVPPLFSNAMPTLTIRGEAHDLALVLSHTRGQAITRNLTQEVRLFPEQRLYIVGEKSRRHFLPKDIKLSVDNGILLDELSGEQAVRFFPDGSASGGVISLSNEQRRYDLEINWLTGRVQTREVGNEAG